MATPPARRRVRRTKGSKIVAEYLDRHGVRPVAVYVPEKWHRAFSKIAIEGDTSLQAIMTLACGTAYGARRDLPPLVAPTRVKQDPHKSVTWYADVDLHKRMKMLAVDLDCSVQQLVMSAVVDYLKDHPSIAALKIKTGVAPYARHPGSATTS